MDGKGAQTNTHTLTFLSSDQYIGKAIECVYFPGDRDLGPFPFVFE